MWISIDWTYIAAASFGVVGVIEYVKGFFKEIPSAVWRAVMPLVCAGVAIAGGGTAFQTATNGVLILATSQIGYESLIGIAKQKLNLPQ